ncbi:MAG: amidohydrolase family protein [Acidobacteria bacterium]|nr:amidohydrolase family protein [Acidobacteriota bacterium]
MEITQASKSAAVRARLNHPVIDADGHILEFEPDFLDYLSQVGGTKVVQQYTAWCDRTAKKGYSWYEMSWQERRDRRAKRPSWWALPAKNTLDRATATLPKLLYERLDEIGLDFTILYPTVALFMVHIEDKELRRACCRAYNTLLADVFREYADRMTPVAIIPMHTPEEAIEELEYAVKALSMKAILIAGYVMRPIRAEAATETFWLDTYGLDSEYNYDPFWAKCVELGVAPTAHDVGRDWGSRQSISNFMYNHIGHFAAADEALCKSLFMGGITRRFPTLKFALLEGGVAWACSLYADLIGHWEKRNPKAVQNYNPANLDRNLLVDLFARYGGKMVEGKLDQAGRWGFGLDWQDHPDNAAMLDEWAPCQIERAEDIRDLFVPNFYFGCEADDPINAWAFNSRVNPFGARLKIILGSDIGHWDVPDMTEVIEEAYELVEKGLITEENFRDFVFTNPVTLHASMNPNFFKGTAVEKEVEKLLAEEVSKSEKVS